MPFFRKLLPLVLYAVLACAAPALADSNVINLISLPSSTAGGVYFAQDMGFFKAAGLDVRITSMTSSPAIISALLSGAADIGFASIGTGASAHERGLSVRFVAPGQVYDPTATTSALVAASDTTMKTAADLNGKTIAVTGLADLSYFATEAWIEKNGGNLASVHFVEIPFPQMAGAVAQHRVDAAVIAEPFLTMAGSAVKPIGDMNGGIGPSFMLAAWIAPDAWIRANPVTAAKFAEVMRKTSDWANMHHKEVADILARNMHMSPDIAATMRIPKYGDTLAPALLQPPIDTAAKYQQKSPVPASDLIWLPGK